MTTIQWTDVTDNPILLRNLDGSHGGHWCKKVSPGCSNCYAEKINQSNYFSFASHRSYTGAPPDNLFFDNAVVQSWAKQRIPKKHFVCSMTDLFGEWVPRDWQFRVFDAAFNAPKQTIQLLTKRPHIAQIAVNEWCTKHDRLQLPPNIWMGTTIENQATADERIPLLLKTPAVIRFLSCEPLLEKVNFQDSIVQASAHHQAALFKITKKSDLSSMIDWVIVGGESGKGARPCQVGWIRSTVRQCKAANVPVFVKQLGSNPMFSEADHPTHFPFCHVTGKGGDIEEFPGDLKIREFPFDNCDRVQEPSESIAFSEIHLMK